MAITRRLTCFKLYMQERHGGEHGESQEETILETPGTYTARQPSIGDEYGGDKEEEDNVNVEGEGEDP